MDPTTAQFVRYRERADVDALGAVFDALAPRLLALALHACGNAADAEDALQATFVVAMQKAHTFDARQPVGGWLAGILAGEASNLRRREQRRRAPPAGSGAAAASANAIERASAGGDGDPVAAGERAELIARLRTHVEALPIEQRQVLLLQLQYGLAPAAIAEVLGVPPGTVRMRLHRGLAALRAVLPVGLLATFAGVLPARGVAAVRAAVLRECEALAAAAGAGAGAGGGTVGFAVSGAAAGGLLVKKLLAAVVIALGCLCAWWGSAIAPTAPPHSFDGAEGSRQWSASPTRDVRSEPSAVAVAPAAREALAAAPGSLLVTVRGVMAQRVSQWESVAVAFPGSGEPVPDVVVEVWRDAASPDDVDAQGATGRTDLGGRVRVESLAAGQWQVALRNAGGDVQQIGSVVVPAGGSADLECHTSVVASLRGRVVDARGAPVAEADVLAGSVVRSVRSDRRHWSPRRAARSAADGSFACAVLAGEERVSARREGFAASWSHPIGPLGDGEGEVTLVLGDGPVRLTLRVVDQHERPVSGARAEVHPRDRQRRRADGDLVAPAVGCLATEVAPGCYVADGLHAGAHEFFVHANDTLHQGQVRLAPHGTADTVLPIPVGVAVTGRVRGRNGASQRGVEIALAANGQNVARPRCTDAQGAFRFAGVPAGPIDVVAVHTASGVRTEHRMLIGAADAHCELQLDVPTPILVRVVDERGAVLADWLVDATQDGAAQRLFDRGDGTFELHGTHAGPTSFAVRSRVDGVVVVERTVDELDAACAVQLVVPDALLPRASLRGRIRLTSGEPAREAIAETTHAAPLLGSDVAADGAFRFDGLAAGRHDLYLRASDVASRHLVVELAAGEQHDVGDVALAPAAQLRVRFLRPDGRPWHGRPPRPSVVDANGADVLGWEHGTDVHVSDGAVVVSGLAAGRYTVAAPADDELVVEPCAVDVVAGTTAAIVLATAVGRRWSLRVRADESLRMLERAEVVVRRATTTAGARSEPGAEVARAAIAPARDVLRADLLLPFGTFVAEVVSDIGVTHRTRFHVTDRWHDQPASDLWPNDPVPVPAAAK